MLDRTKSTSQITKLIKGKCQNKRKTLRGKRNYIKCDRKNMRISNQEKYQMKQEAEKTTHRVWLSGSIRFEGMSDKGHMRAGWLA